MKNIESLGKLLPLGSIFIILCSSIKLFIYYSAFNISIVEYLGIGEYATLFIDDLLNYLIIFGFSLLLNYQFLFKKNQSNNQDNFDYSIFKRTRLWIIVYIVILVVGVTITMIINNNLDFKLNLLKVALYILLCLIYSYCLFIKKPNFSYLSLMVSAVIIYTIMNGIIDSNKIHQGLNKLNYSIKYEEKKIITNDSLQYLGKSEKYIFLYDKLSKESTILTTDNLIQIKISKKQ